MGDYLEIARDDNNEAFQAARLGDPVHQVNATAASAASGAVNARLIRVWGNVDFHLVQGAGTPVAATTSSPMAAKASEHFRHIPGEKVAVIKATGEVDGIVWITEME